MTRAPPDHRRRLTGGAQGPQEAILRHAPGNGKTPVIPLCTKTHGPLNLSNMHSCNARADAHTTKHKGKRAFQPRAFAIQIHRSHAGRVRLSGLPSLCMSAHHSPFMSLASVLRDVPSLCDHTPLTSCHLSTSCNMPLASYQLTSNRSYCQSDDHTFCMRATECLEMNPQSSVQMPHA